MSLKQIVRRFVRPLLSPIDGRVADINSRVDHTAQHVDRVEAAVGSFAESSQEASAYIGVELQRLATLYEGLETSTRELTVSEHEEYYRGKLAAAADLPLEQIDGALAALINHAGGHEGPAAQANLWFNSPVGVEISDGAARLTTVNERIVEVPFAMMALARLQRGARLLDVGSAESTFPLSAASLGYEVTAVDPRGLPYTHPNLDVVAGRLEDLSVSDRRFDAVFLISTIEHVGLPAYGITPHGDTTPGRGADRELMRRIQAELLTPGGFVVLTTPYGERAVTGFERTYDDDALTELLDGWTVVERTAISRAGGLAWTPCDTSDAVDEDGVVMMIASPAST